VHVVLAIDTSKLLDGLNQRCLLSMSEAGNPCYKFVRVFHGASSEEMIFILGQRLESTPVHTKSQVPTSHFCLGFEI
jgi:hypothetical protein